MRCPTSQRKRSLDESGKPRWLEGTREVILLAMACLAPWAFGSVEAWAELGLYLGVAALGVLGALAGRGSASRRHVLCTPGLALAGLALLAWAQASTLPPGVLRRLDPATVREYRA